MILKEVSVERLAFTCGGRGTVWSADYDVQDGHGHDRDYYVHDGLPCRPSPVVTPAAAGHLGIRPGSEKTATRAGAPLLAAAGVSSEANS